MLFDQARDLPMATVRRAPHSTIPRIVGELEQWFSARWAWLRPRTLPALVALVGMFAVLSAVNYLSRPPAAAITMADVPTTEAPTYGFHVKLVLQP
jgi:hypothetical protein